MEEEKKEARIIRGGALKSTVYDFKAQKLPMQRPESAQSFVQFQTEQGNDFIINHHIADKSGVADITHRSLEAEFEQNALEKIKKVEEDAYQKAYQLGIEEGKKAALKEHGDEIESGLDSVKTMVEKIKNLKKELVTQNESNILSMTYYLASRIAMREIEQNEELVKELVEKVVEESQLEEDITVKISNSDHDFLASIDLKEALRFEHQIKLEVDDSITKGGCIIETNYGAVDATVEQRVEKLWTRLKEKLPRVKEQVGSDE